MNADKAMTTFQSRRSFLPIFLIWVLATGAISYSAKAQIVFTETFHTYTEDFSSMAYGLDKPWIDNRTLPGWFYLPTFGPSSAMEVSSIYTQGPNGTPGLQLFTDTDNPPTIRALGSLTNGAIENQYWVSQVIFGFSIQNDSNAVIDAITISFDQVQWYGGTAAAADSMEFSYSTDATDLESGTWIAVSDLDLKDFKNGQGGVPLTIRPREATLSNLALKVGGTIWFRWVDKQAEGGNAGAGVANLKVSAVIAKQAP